MAVEVIAIVEIVEHFGGITFQNIKTMTNEHKFKKGDIVVFKGEHLHISEEIIKDDILTVYDVSEDGNKVWVKHPAVGKVDASELDMHLPYDRKTAFLRELQGLLRKYDAFFVAHKTDMPVSVYFNDNENDIPFASIGKEINKGCGVIVTADNIMDFDKE